MKHHATSDFWDAYAKLPAYIQKLADRSFVLLKSDPRHPSLHFQRVGRFWSVRVGISHRALAIAEEDAVIWFWIGSHADYDKLLAP